MSDGVIVIRPLCVPGGNPVGFATSVIVVGVVPVVGLTVSHEALLTADQLVGVPEVEVRLTLWTTESPSCAAEKESAAVLTWSVERLGSGEVTSPAHATIRATPTHRAVRHRILICSQYVEVLGL